MKPTSNLKAGNAVDASVAAALCACVVHPHATSLGGDGIMMVAQRNASNGQYDHKIMDFRGPAPSTKTATFYATRPLSATAAVEASTIPTLTRGLHAGWAKWSRGQAVGREWSDVVQPVIDLAEQGFPIDEELHKHLEANAVLIGDTPALREVFAVNGTILPQGTVVKWPGMATTLRLVQADPQNFHVSDAMKADYAATKMWEHFLETDLTSYEPVLRTPIKVEVGGHTAYVPPPPAAGGILSVALQLMDEMNISSLSVYDRARYHKLAEAFKLAFQQDALWGQVRTGVMSVLARLSTSPEAIADLLQQYDDMEVISSATKPTANGTTAQPAPIPNTPAESAIAAIDHQRMAVSVVTGMGTHFGSGIMLPGTQVMMNNHMQSFTLVHDHPNLLDPKKLPFTTRSPLIVMDGSASTDDVSMAASAQGGPASVTALAQVLFSALSENKSVKDSVTAPRMHSHTMPSEEVVLEGGMLAFVKPYLEGLGHTVASSKSLGSVMAVGASSRGVWTAADPRSG
jgi:gamma-glutamyltranspeptidase/glutathione hydrolase